MTWWWVLGCVCIVLSFPVDGLFGVLLGVAGVVMLWVNFVKVLHAIRGGDR